MHVTEIINNYLIPYITHLGIFGYWIAAAATLLETILIIGLFVPGSTIVLIFGALSAAGYYDFWYLMVFTVTSAMLGDYINYRLGKKYGRSWFIEEKWFLKKSYLQKGKRFFDTYGAKSLSFGRLIPSLKETFPFIAGSMDTKLSKFLFWDTLGAIAWGFEFLTAGYLFGSSINLARAWLGRISVFAAVIFFIFAALYAVKFFFARYGLNILQFQKSIWQSIRTNPDVLKFTDKYPRFFAFLSSRLTVKRFSGLTLTILSIAFIYILFLLTDTTLEVLGKGTLFKFDIMLASLVAYFRDAGMIKIVLFITMFGNSKIIILLSIMVIILFLVYKKNYILPFLISITGSAATTWSIKYLLHRPRPYEAYYHAVGFSFPSGHATIAAAFYGFLTYIFVIEMKNLKSKLNAVIIGLSVILLIGASRIYLDVHYFSDVWAGYLIGACWLVIAVGICEYLNFNKPKTDIKIDRNAKYISYALSSLFFVFCIILAVNFNPKPIKQKLPRITPVNNALYIFKNNYTKYTTTILGKKQEPMNLIIIAEDDSRLIEDIRQAGWHFADKLSFESIKKSINALIYNRPYSKAPISPDFWNYKVNNFGIERLVRGESIKLRHHGRIWKTDCSINGRQIYAVSVSFDTRLKWIVHKISPNIDKEREMFFNNLSSKHLIERYKKIQFVKPFIGSNFYGDNFFTDGEAYIIWLK